MTKLDENDIVEYLIMSQVTEGMGVFGSLITAVVYLGIAVLFFAIGVAFILAFFLEIFNTLFA